jgi:nitrite reductase/ring-hydroxylating ferredoxin subunit
VNWHKVARSNEVDRRLQRVEVDGEAVLVARTADGDPVAVEVYCPHQHKPMDGAAIYGDEIDCPHHHYTYDARTGENRYPKRVFPRSRAATVQSIRAYETRDDGEWVWVRTP